MRSTARYQRRSTTVRAGIIGILAMVMAFVVSNEPVRGVSSDIVISQVYGGGGNSGAPYRNDFVELFNRGSAPVSLAGKSIQYTSAAGTGSFGASASLIAQLTGTLAPGQYYLVQLASNAAVGAFLPTPDVIGTINMSGTGGKVALVNSTTGLACNGGSAPCSAAQLALIIDLVGWDGANFFEGAAAPATTNTTAVLRADYGCTETDNNAADFTASAPAPRSTASAVHSCSGPTNPTGTAAATPASVAAGANSLLTVTVVSGANPTSTGIGVTADLTSIGGLGSQQFFNDGTNGDVTTGDNTFSFNATVASSTTTGNKSLPVTVSDGQSRSSTASITLAVVPPPMLIHAIQGAGSTSPYAEQMVTTSGVVTARRYNNGFFIQTPDALVDGDPNTSEAIFVYTSSAPTAVAAVGVYVQVTGTAAEYVPDPYGPSMTEIISPMVSALSTAYPMPLPVTLTAADLPANGTLDQLERFEAMRVHVPFLRTVSPTQGTISEPAATSTSNGVFYAVIDGVARPFREPGIQTGYPLPAGAPATVPRFDFNPERLRVNSYGQVGAARIEVTSGALLSNVVGVLDFAYLTWTILPDTSTPPAVSGVVAATAVPVPDVNEFTVASFNMGRFFDTVNDPGSDAVLTPIAFQNRLNKASLAIRTMMRSPDILGVQEMENLSTLQAVADRLNADTVAAGEPNPGYVAYLEEGNDPGGIDVGFLVRTSRVTVLDVVQEGLLTTYVNPTTGANDLLNDRPPLVLTAQVQGPSGMLPVTAIVNHIRSLSGIDDPVDGRVRTKRLAQAEFLAALIQKRQTDNPAERIISVGDYNAFQVNDGYVDVIGAIKGTPSPADQVTLAGADVVNPDLTDLVDLMSESERYSYSYDGSAQVLDHIIVNGAALQRLSRIHYARSNADFPESYRWDATRPERLSDHDMPVAYFVFPEAPVLTLTGLNPLPVECCSAFTDPGATALDADLGNITSLVTVTGSVDTATVGAYTLTYSVNNGYTTTTATRTVNVVDTTPPVLALTGANPMTVEVGSLFVDPGATASDTCAHDLTNFILFSGTVDPAHVGAYQITYTVSDGYNTSAITRTVNVVDTTPPVMSAVSPNPSALWPPNHQFIAVGLGYTATDNSGASTCSVGVLSNEPVNGTGDGDTSPDWLVNGRANVQLRSERAGGGSGRVYTITVTCQDASGNAATKSTTVNVPQSKGK